MTGRTGNDTYFVENAEDKIIEKFNEDTDTASSKIIYTFPANVGDLKLTGTAEINATRNVWLILLSEIMLQIN